MLSKKIICFFSVLLLFLGLMFSVRASSTPTIEFDSNGVTVVLTYPEEAHPDSAIYHNVTITANTDLDSVSVSLYIYAPVNSTLQHIKNQTLSWSSLPENQSLPKSEIKFTPQQANGTLYCNMTVQTEIASTMYYASYSFYTTRVSELTFSEMQNLYNEMLANYASLQEDYETLLDDYNSLLADYSILSADYTALLSEYDTLANKYSGLNETYQELLNEYIHQSDEYNTKIQEYNTIYLNHTSTTRELGVLRSEYTLLNSTCNSLQANYTSLRANYTSLKEDCDALNETYNDLLTDLNNLQESKDSALNTDRIIMIVFIVAVAALIAFIVYLKRKKEQPYVVIRKETVSMKPDEKT